MRSVPKDTVYHRVPYGFYPADNCAVTYFSIQFQGVNAKNFGDYPAGFTPQNTEAQQPPLPPHYCPLRRSFLLQSGCRVIPFASEGR